MSGGPNDSNDEDDRTVIIPAGESGRPAAPPPSPADASAWPEEEATRAIDLSKDAEPAPPDVDETPEAAPASLWPGDPGAGRTDIAEGSILGNYRVGRLIAQGGLGAIYEGVNAHNPAERVAIKVILPDPTMGDRFAKMLLDEANALMRVRHDAVVPYRTYGRIADTNEFYLVLEFIDGDTLNDFYRRRPLTETEVFALAHRLAGGLQASHDEGLVHRDISPDNVLLPQNQLDKATLIDFGIAKIGDVEDQPDAQFSGKLSYAAPEQFVRGSRIGPWTDVYSLALLLVAAARGQSLPMGSTLEEAQDMRREAPALPAVPERLVPPLQRMLEPHPGDRPQSMREVLTLLDAAQNPVPAEPVPPPEPGPDVAPVSKSGIRRMERAAEAKPRRRSGGWLSILLVLLVGAAVAGGIVLYGDGFFRRDQPVVVAGRDLPPVVPAPLPPASRGPGVPKLPETPVPPPAAQSRAEQLADILTAIRGRLAGARCAMTRVSGGDQGSTFAIEVGGLWGNAAAVESLAKGTTAAGVTVALRGETVDTSLCPALDRLASAGPLGDMRLARPRAAGADSRASIVTVMLPASGPAALLEVDAAGAVATLADLSAGAPRDSALGAGALVDLGGGRFDLTLTPPSDTANVAQTLLLLVTGTAPPSATSLDAWVEALSTGNPKPAIDLMPRDAIAVAAVPPPMVEADSGAARQALLIAATKAVRDRLDRVSCSLVRLVPGASDPPFAFQLGGLWGDRAAIDAAAAEASQASGATIAVDGTSVDNRFCSVLDVYKGNRAELGPAILETSQGLQDGSRATNVTLNLEDSVRFQLLDVDTAGRIVTVLDASSDAGRIAAIERGTLTGLGGNRFQAKLVPIGPTANVETSLLLVVTGDVLLPADGLPSSPVTFAEWVSRNAATLAGVTVDMAPRAGIPAATPPLVVQSPPVAGATPPPSDTAARFAAVACSMVRLTTSPAGTAVEGQWGREADIKAVADALAAETGQQFLVSGRTLTGRQCTFVDALKPVFRADASVSLLPPEPTGKPDASSAVGLVADPAAPNLYLLWIDASGTVRPLIDLSSADSRAAAANRGRLVDQGGGRYQAILPPYSPNRDTAPGLLLAISSASPLSPDLLRARAFRDWVRDLTKAAPSDQIRVDIAEYRQAAMN